MKRILLVCIFSNIITVFAQKIGDTITMSLDTINIHGVVIDENRKPVANADIFALAYTMHSRYTNSYWQAKTNNVGYFTLNGIKPIDTLFIYTSFGKEKLINYGSRYLLVTVKKNDIIEYKSPSISITAKRKSKKPYNKLKLIYTGNWHEPEDRYDEPEYSGRTGKLWEFIKQNLKYPDLAVEKNIEGIVVLEFTVGRDGYIKDIEIIRDIGYGCGEEAIKVLKSSKRWYSALQNGKPVEKRISIQIPFKLTD